MKRLFLKYFWNEQFVELISIGLGLNAIFNEESSKKLIEGLMGSQVFKRAHVMIILPIYRC